MEGNYGWGLPVAASTFAGDIDWGIKIIHVAMVGIFVLWGIFFTYLLIRYRQRPGVPANVAKDPLWKSLLPDAAVLVFELFLIFAYALPSWSRIKLNFPKPEESNVVEVVAEQFAWNFQYAGADGVMGRRDAKFIDSTNVLGLDMEDPHAKDDVVTLNEMHLPLGKKTLVYLSSKDVIHSLFIPEFRIKQDAMPGMRVPVWFEPTLAGKYEIACAQLCGNAHATMRGDVIVHAPEEFEAWLKENAPKPE